MKKSPIKYRRLTKAEAARLGVSHKAKRRVDASIKRVTKTTKLYTDRQVAEAKLGSKKEVYTEYRVSEPAENGMRVYRNVHRNEHFRLQKIAGVRICQIIAYGRPKHTGRRKGGSSHDGGGPGDEYTRSFGFTGDELKHNLDEIYTEKGWLGFSTSNPPTHVDVLIYMGKN